MQEGLTISDRDILAECVFAKNALVVVYGETPYQAVLGRCPNLLREFEAPGVSVIDDDNGGSRSKYATRVRELSIQHMVEGTARDRLTRALKTQTRVAGEQLELAVGDLVDIHRPSSSKDASGWRGPAKVISTSNLEHGFIECQWGGRSLSVRIPDIFAEP